eukprot:COSAG01_NODE_45764_length_406_cov_1.296417_2_plen_66_part_01
MQDVVHSENRLYLVFEYLDQDLKKYMESVDPEGMPPMLIRVRGRLPPDHDALPFPVHSMPAESSPG